MSFNSPFEVIQPVRVIFGRGQLSELGNVTAQLGQRIFLLTMNKLVELGLVEKATASLKEAGLDVVVFDGVTPEPTCTQIDAASQHIRNSGADVLVALGGGSVIDVAKAAAIGVSHSQPIWQYVNLSNRPSLPIEPSVLSIIAVPTTAGTGSEVTPYAVICNDEAIQKGTIKSPFIFPKVAIVDPELTLDLPPELTAATGIDAFTHALESYLNEANRTPFSDMMAVEAMRILHQTLPKVVDNEHDIALRAQMLWGSMLAGIAIANAGTTVAHALAQPLGAHSHLSHSQTVAFFTLPVLHQTWPFAIERFANLARMLEPGKVSGLSLRQQAEKAVVLIERLFDIVGMNQKITEYQIPENITELLSEDVWSYMSRAIAQHVKQFSRSEMLAIIEDAM